MRQGFLPKTMFIAMRVFIDQLKQEPLGLCEYLMLNWKTLYQQHLKVVSWCFRPIHSCRISRPFWKSLSVGRKNETTIWFPPWPHDNYKNQPCEVVTSQYPLSKDPGFHTVTIGFLSESSSAPSLSRSP